MIAALVVFFVAFLIWLFKESSKPLPGQKQTDEGRDHVNINTEIVYKTNPPTSGKHYSDWIRPGIYDSPKDDRNLIHSLEHGYIIMSYQCQVVGGSKQEATNSGEVENKSLCEERKNQLAKIYQKKSQHKLIVVPRPNLDTNFALTAWTYLDKFNDFDQTRIENFIDAHRDQGPERTME